MVASPLHVLYLSVTPDILERKNHFRRVYLQELGKRVSRIAYLVHAPHASSLSPEPIAPNVTLYPVRAFTKWGYIRKAVRLARALHAERHFDLAVCMTPVAPAAQPTGSGGTRGSRFSCTGHTTFCTTGAGGWSPPRTCSIGPGSAGSPDGPTACGRLPNRWPSPCWRLERVTGRRRHPKKTCGPCDSPA